MTSWKNTREASKNQENRVAKMLMGKRQLNSGATSFHKGDVIGENFLIECKTTLVEKGSYSVKKGDIEKNSKESIAMRKEISALAFDYGDGGDIYFVLDSNTFIKLLNAYNEKDEE